MINNIRQASLCLGAFIDTGKCHGVKRSFFSEEVKQTQAVCYYMWTLLHRTELIICCNPMVTPLLESPRQRPGPWLLLLSLSLILLLPTSWLHLYCPQAKNYCFFLLVMGNLTQRTHLQPQLNLVLLPLRCYWDHFNWQWDLGSVPLTSLGFSFTICKVRSVIFTTQD